MKLERAEVAAIAANFTPAPRAGDKSLFHTAPPSADSRHPALPAPIAAFRPADEDGLAVLGTDTGDSVETVGASLLLGPPALHGVRLQVETLQPVADSRVTDVELRPPLRGSWPRLRLPSAASLDP